MKTIVKDIMDTFLIIYVLISLSLGILDYFQVGLLPINGNIFFIIFLFAIAGALPSFITHYKKEPTISEIIIRRMLQLLCVELLELFVGWKWCGFQISYIIRYMLVIFIIYVAEFAIQTIMEWFQAKKISEEILTYKNRK